MDAVLEEVRERIDVCGGDIRVGRQIGGRVEGHDDPARASHRCCSDRAIDVRRHVAVSREIAGGVAARGTAPFVPAEVLKCNGSTCAATSGLCRVVDIVEAIQARSARSARAAAFSFFPLKSRRIDARPRRPDWR